VLRKYLLSGSDRYFVNVAARCADDRARDIVMGLINANQSAAGALGGAGNAEQQIMQSNANQDYQQGNLLSALFQKYAGGGAGMGGQSSFMGIPGATSNSFLGIRGAYR